MPEHQTNKERLKEITDSIEKGIQELFQSDKYARYLRTMSRFHRYSLNNTMLIYMQKPEATLVAGFNRWRDQFGRNVMKGEKGIKIIAPTPFKKKVEKERLDPDTHLPMLDADGKVMTEEKEIQIPMFKPVTVFDVSQTQGRPLPQLASDLTGNVENYKDFMEALSKASPVPIHIQPVAGGADGFFDPETQSITIREGMSEIQTVSAAVHEIAHSKLHNYEHDDNTDPSQHKSRRTEEVEAESISYAVCAYFGISTGENSFGYIASWSKDKELPELKASLETINKTSSELITDIDRNYTQLVKARQEALKQKREQRQMNVLEMVDYFMSQGISEEQANELAAAEWEAGKASSAPLQQPKAEDDFFKSTADGFAVYQLHSSDETSKLMFMDSAWLGKEGLVPRKENYDFIYYKEMKCAGSQADQLEQIYHDLNVEKPEDFAGRSLSVSDVIVLRRNGAVSCHYVDSLGYKELPDFLSRENYLKGAEMQVEDDYNMIDGIVNNGARQEANEAGKSSVLEKLHSYQKESHQSVHNRAERDLE